jgi:hypothetical protein
MYLAISSLGMVGTSIHTLSGYGHFLISAVNAQHSAPSILSPCPDTRTKIVMSLAPIGMVLDEKVVKNNVSNRRLL